MLFKNRNLIRFLRLALGLIILAEGLKTASGLTVAAGLALTLIPLFNTGCCAAANCTAPANKNTETKRDNLVYEEITSPKMAL